MVHEASVSLWLPFCVTSTESVDIFEVVNSQEQSDLEVQQSAFQSDRVDD